MSPLYLQKEIVAMMRDPLPGGWQRGMTQDGYTVRRGAPTSYKVLLAGETRWRRLMVWQFSNAGTCFLRIGGETQIVPSHSL